MKWFIVLLLFSQTAFAVDKKAILEQLMGIHGANWSSLASSQSDYNEIKETLHQVITGDLDLAEYGYSGDVTADIVQSAISEYGNFISVDSKGKLSRHDKDLILKLKSNINGDNQSHDALAYYELLKNSGSAEGLELLSESLTETENLSTLYTIERTLHQGLAGEEKNSRPKDLDSSYIKYYRPHLKNSWKERPGDWKSALKKINSRIKIAEEIVKQKSQDQRFINAFGEIRGKIQELSKAEEKEKRQVLIKESTEANPENPKKVKKVKDREISSIDKEDEQEANHWGIPWAFVLFAFILFFLIRSAARR